MKLLKLIGNLFFAAFIDFFIVAQVMSPPNRNIFNCTNDRIMTITASKLRTIQMLGIGEVNTYLGERLIDQAIKGEDSVTVPESVLSNTERETLTEAGFTVTYESTIGEYEISWRLNDG